MKLHLVKTRFVNSYIIEEQDRLAVVDVSAGCAEHVAGHVEQVLDRSIEDIKLIACTHDDMDHLGGIRGLARASGAKVAIPYASRNLRRKWLNDPTGIMVRPASPGGSRLRHHSARPPPDPCLVFRAGTATRRPAGTNPPAYPSSGRPQTGERGLGALLTTSLRAGFRAKNDYPPRSSAENCRLSDIPVRLR